MPTAPPQILRVLTALVLLAAPAALRAELIPPDVVFPRLPREGKSQADFVPAGWMVEKQAQADLNGDNRLDFMMVLHMADPKNVVANPDGFGVDELDTNPRMLVVGFQDQRHRFHLQAANHTLIPRQTNPVLDDPLADAEVKNGALKISLGFWASAGSWYSSQVEYTLRFQSDCFRLIGYDYEETKRNTWETSAISVNYLTGKVKTSKGTIEDDVMQDKWRPLRGKRKVCLDDIGDGMEFHPEP
ncbi:MAG: hypothetical protein ACJ75H_15255 [Thermoanaerobaculia bacterium]